MSGLMRILQPDIGLKLMFLVEFKDIELKSMHPA